MKPVRNLLPALLMIVLFACTKESFTTNPADRLNTSEDTLHFDTVFTSTGSISQVVKIINNNNNNIKVSSVKIAGGNNSFFKINVDGIPGPEVKNVDIAANDSAYVFVTVSINPNANNLPFLVRDSIEVSYNGNRKFIQLDAFGRNAHFFRDRTISANETWNN